MSTAYHTKPATLVSKNVTQTTVTEFFRGASDVYADMLRANEKQEYHLFVSKQKPEIVAVVRSWVGQEEQTETDKNLVVVAKNITPFYNLVAEAKESGLNQESRIVFGTARGKAFTPFAVCELNQLK